jgi:hypothetical protein
MIYFLATLAGLVLALGAWLAWEAVHDVNEPRNGAYSDYLEQKADEMREERYSDVLRDAGRWHLVGHDD